MKKLLTALLVILFIFLGNVIYAEDCGGCGQSACAPNPPIEPASIDTDNETYYEAASGGCGGCGQPECDAEYVGGGEGQG